MPTTINFRKLLHRKQWSQIANCPVSNLTAGNFVVQSRLADQFVFHCSGTAALNLYNPFEDAWATMPSPGLTTFAAGADGAAVPTGPSGTATAGTTTTLTTNLTIPIDLRGYHIRITGGPGAGDVRTIASNTLGTNSVITVTSAFSATITAASTYTLMTGRYYFFGAGTLVTTSFRVFDYALQTFASLSITGLPGTFGTDGQMVSTSSIDRGIVQAFATGTATSGSATTLANTGKAWATNQWANYQLRITAGTGAGQIRTITSNTATVITIPTGATLDATSQYSIEGNDDFLYLMGNGTTATFRYSISGNSWSTMAVRGNAVGVGLSANWIIASNQTDWTNENAIINGRRIYSWRGGGSAALDYYDIPSNAWVNTLAHGPATHSPTTGFRHVDYKGKIYSRNTNLATATQQWLVYDCPSNTLVPWHGTPLLSVAPTVGKLAFVAEYIDGATVIPYLYCPIENSGFVGNLMFRTPIQ